MVFVEVGKALEPGDEVYEGIMFILKQRMLLF